MALFKHSSQENNHSASPGRAMLTSTGSLDQPLLWTSPSGSVLAGNQHPEETGEAWALPAPTPVAAPLRVVLISPLSALEQMIRTSLELAVRPQAVEEHYWLQRFDPQSAITLETTQPDLILVDAVSNGVLAFLEREGHSRLGVGAYVAVVPNREELVLFDKEIQAFRLQAKWQAYFKAKSYANVLVLPEEKGSLHDALQQALLDRSVHGGLPPPTDGAPSRADTPDTFLPAQAVQTAQAPAVPGGYLPAQQEAALVPLAPAPARLENTRVTDPPAAASPHPALPLQAGVFAAWSPFDRVGRTTAMLELGTSIAGILGRVVVGEMRRVGLLEQYIALDEAALGRSLVTLARLVERHERERLQRDPTHPFALEAQLVGSACLTGLPVDLGPHPDPLHRLEFFHSGRASQPEIIYQLSVLNDEHPFLRELIKTLRESFLFTLLIVGSNPLDPVVWPALDLCQRLLIFLPADPVLLQVAEGPMQLVLRLLKKTDLNVDLVLTQWNRNRADADLTALQRACLEAGQLDGEKQQRRLLKELSLEGPLEELCRKCKLSSVLAALLPDEQPLRQHLRLHGERLPAVMQAEFATHPYVRAIRAQLLPAYVEVESALPSRLPDMSKLGRRK